MVDIVPPRLFSFWTGSERMGRRRRASVKVLRESCGLKFELVTSKNLREWVVAGAPLHPCYPYLSSTHKSDYLRSYFMLHHGGGYADVKPLTWDWQGFVGQLALDTVDFYGSPEGSPGAIAGDDLIKAKYESLVSNCAFLFRPHSQFALEWQSRVHGVLDSKMERIMKSPGTYHPRAVEHGIHGYKWWDRDKDPRGYPLRWAEIQGEIFHQLQFENPGTYKSELPPLEFGRYR